MLCFPDHHTILPIHLRVEMYFGGHALIKMEEVALKLLGDMMILLGFDNSLLNTQVDTLHVIKRSLTVLSLCCPSPLPFTGLRRYSWTWKGIAVTFLLQQITRQQNAASQKAGALS